MPLVEGVVSNGSPRSLRRVCDGAYQRDVCDAFFAFGKKAFGEQGFAPAGDKGSALDPI